VNPGELSELFGEAPLEAPTLGIEEELMLLDPDTLDLLPRSAGVLDRLGGDPRFKPELPLAQLELLTAPTADLEELAGELALARRDLAAAAEDVGVLAGSGAHPFAAAEGELNPADEYRFTRDEYGPVARRQLVFGLHVHVRIGGAERSLAVYNALRSHLPELAALAANAPLHAGRDTGMASIRPKISELLPRQGVPPAFASFEDFAGALGWAAASGATPRPRMWWWELRLHPVHGTIEIRVPDQQTTAAESVAVAELARGLVLDLAARHDAGEELPVHPSWRIAENRWSAGRHGLDGSMADLDSGERIATRERVMALAERCGAGRALGLAAGNGASRQRAWAAEVGVEGATRELAARFLA
jgi:carboxylate-amine ligase